MQIIKNIFHEHKAMAVTITIVLAVIVVSCIGALVAGAVVLNNQKIYNGVYISDLHVGGMTLEEAKTAVKDHFTDVQDAEICFKLEDFEKKFALSELSAEIDYEKSVQQAYEVARVSNAFGRIKTIMNLRREPVVLPPFITCDDALLEASLSEIAEQFDAPGREMEISIGETELTVTRGVPGLCLNIPKTMTRFKESALSLKDGLFVLELEEIIPTEPNAEVIFNQVCGDPIDATYTIENQRLTIVEEKPGIDFNKATAQGIIDSTEGDTIVFPIVVIPPNVTAEQINEELFPDLLATYSSKYNAGDTSRSHNLSLASQKINDVVLAPGDVFSYNDTVGPRTISHGFKTANVYVGNRVEPGIGGGICQVSSTLFNAVVLADLKIVYRTNHSLPVSYVPLGRDATVSYGSIDFKFSNNTSHPVKIVASASGGTNTVSVYGVKENPNRTIELRSECTGTIPARLVQKEDPTLPTGTVNVEQAGSSGSHYNTYKITLENGTVVKTELLTKSTYVAKERIEIIGTMPGDIPVIGEPGTSLPSDELPNDASSPTETPEGSDAPIAGEEPPTEETPVSTDSPELAPTPVAPEPIAPAAQELPEEPAA